MSLPKIVDFPTYTTTIPSTRKEVLFRPFLVKEQKMMMIAYESQDMSSIVRSTLETVSACLLDKDVRIENLPTYDIDYLFTQIRSKSVGENTEMSVTCQECETSNPFKVNLDEIKVTGEAPGEKIIPINDDYQLRLRHPSYKSIANRQMFSSSLTATEMLFTSISSCLDAILTDEEQVLFDDESDEEIITFIDNLPTALFNQIQEYANDVPKMRYEDTLTCENKECGKPINIALEGIQDFF